MEEKNLPYAINLQPEMKSWYPQDGTLFSFLLFGICV